MSGSSKMVMSGSSKIFVLACIFLFVLSVGPVLAAKPAPPDAAAVRIPEHAVEVAPGVLYLGTAKDGKDGKVIEGYAIINYLKGAGKPPRPFDTSSCHAFLAKGARWKTLEPWLVNPANTQGLASDFVFAKLGESIGKWEAAAGEKDILRNGSVTNETLVADFSSPDGKNEVYFGSIAQPGAIAITVIWGRFGGSVGSRELVEWDQVYDQADFSWSATGEAGKMDFENIATHELGHSVGMNDLYDGRCGEQTMYGYADYGETKKRTLESGDIAGIATLYK